MKQASYYEKSGSSIQCLLCPRFCVLQNGQTGFCGVRKVVDNELYSLIYGKISSLAIDPIEKKPVYHFHPGSRTLSAGTAGCNMRCLHCQNSTISHVNAEYSSLDPLSPEELVALAGEKSCPVLVWTYNEPSIWIEYVIDSGRLAKKAGLDTVMVTAGSINPEPLNDILKVVDVYRLDIKAFSGALYKQLTGFDFFTTVLNSAKTAKEAGCHIEIVTNIIPGFNDDEEQLSGIAAWICENLGEETPWHVTAYHPAYKLNAPATSPDHLDAAVKTGRKAGLKHIFAGNIPGHPAQHTLCPACSTVLVKRSGFRIIENTVQNGVCPQCGYTLNNWIS